MHATKVKKEKTTKNSYNINKGWKIVKLNDFCIK